MAQKVLVVDVGGTHLKILASGQRTPRKIASGRKMTAQRMCNWVKKAASDWHYEVAAIGYPGPVVHGRPVHEPYNMSKGWVGFDYAKGLGCPVKVINDAAMQAIGSYQGGRMLFLGLGTGLGSAMIVDGIVEPMELAHLPYKKGKTYEDYVVLGGGNVKKIKTLPAQTRLGANGNAFVGGYRLWSAERGTGTNASPRSYKIKDKSQSIPQSTQLPRMERANRRMNLEPSA